MKFQYVYNISVQRISCGFVTCQLLPTVAGREGSPDTDYRMLSLVATINRARLDKTQTGENRQ